MRKLTAALFALLLFAAMAGCSSDDSDDPVDGDDTSQTGSNGDGGADGSEDDPSEDPSDEDQSDEDQSDEDPADEPSDDGEDSTDEADSGEQVSVPSDLVDDIKAMAADEDEDVTDGEAACIAEMMVIVLGEDGARDAVAGGVDEVEAAMSQATDDFSDESYGEMVTSLSDECRTLMTGESSVDVEGGAVEAPGLGD